MELPRIVVLKSKYTLKNLSYIKDEGEMHGYLKFSGEEVVSPYSKYEVELSESGNRMVNIRCCYNNKYWVRSSESSSWIVAAADKPEEDKSKWSCTLFEPIYVDTAKTRVRFLHIQLKKYACFWGTGDLHYACLYAGSNTVEDVKNELIVIDWEALVIFPKHVAFKGYNGYYLGGIWAEGSNAYLQFAAPDNGSERAGHEVFLKPDGTVRIRSDYFGKFWRRGPKWNWIHGNDSNDNSSNDPDTLFKPIKIGTNLVALRNLGNNNFCKGHTTEGKTNCLHATNSMISKEARLVVEELVLLRSIYNVSYRLTDARIYSESILTMAHGIAVNNTKEPNTMVMKLAYTETTSKTWNSSVSFKLGVTTSIKMGIPKISKVGVQITSEFSGEYKWGQTDESKMELETLYSVIVPPMTLVKVSLLATKGTCDVPFSYTQRDTLTNGHQTIKAMDDGVYTGANCFNFKYETLQEKL